MSDIDWSDPTSKITEHFSVKEALWLPTWSRMATEEDGLTDEIKANLIKTFEWMESIRAFFGKPINVHVTYRPEAYNKQIGGALHSQHSLGCAVDFDVVGLNCDTARQMILDNHQLEALQLRMEQNPGGNWVHLDSGQPHPNRYFKP